MNLKLFTIDEVASYLGVHRDTVYSLIRSGRLAATQLGGRKTGWRISEADLTAFIDAGKTATPAMNGNSLSEQQAMERFENRQREEMESFQQAQNDERRDFLRRRIHDRESVDGAPAS